MMNGIRKFIVLGLVFIICSFGFEKIFANPLSQDALVEERNRLQLQMAELRIELLRNNTELRDLNDRIVNLQKQLIKRLAEQPKMLNLVGRLNEVQSQLDQLENR